MNRTPEQQYFFQRMQEGGEAAVEPNRVIEEMPNNAVIRGMYDHFGSTEAVRRELDESAVREILIEKMPNFLNRKLLEARERRERLESPARNFIENEIDSGSNVGSLIDNQMMNADQTTMKALLSLLENGEISPQEAEQALNRIKQKEREPAVEPNMTDGLGGDAGRQPPSPLIQKYGSATGVQLENLLMENPEVDELTALRALVDSGAIDPRAIEIFMAHQNTGAGQPPPVYEDVPAYQGQPTENVEPPNAYFMDRLKGPSNDGGLGKLRSDLLNISNDADLPPTFFNVTRQDPNSNDGGLGKLRSDLLNISNDAGLPPNFFNVTRQVPNE